MIAGVMAGDDTEFLARLDARLHGLLGALSAPSPRASFPLSGLAVDVAGQRRIALVGEAAHVVPPIGAQGLNLGLRDAASLADCVADARARGDDIGGQAVLARYAAHRSPDVTARINGVDLLNRSLLLDFFPIQAARGIGLHLLANSAALRRAAMHSGLEPVGARPRLMQPGAL
jgi:2-octaprenyl-6-methoxyphenol hydroxylase